MLGDLIRDIEFEFSKENDCIEFKKEVNLLPNITYCAPVEEDLVE
jgi:hypothetical protein